MKYLLFFQGNIGYANAPPFYVISTLRVLLTLDAGDQQTWRSAALTFKQKSADLRRRLRGIGRRYWCFVPTGKEKFRWLSSMQPIHYTDYVFLEGPSWSVGQDIEKSLACHVSPQTF
jgi:hypothetical protein